MRVFISVAVPGSNGEYTDLHIETTGTSHQTLLDNIKAGGFTTDKGAYTIVPNKYIKLAVFQVIKILAKYAMDGLKIKPVTKNSEMMER